LAEKNSEALICSQAGEDFWIVLETSATKIGAFEYSKIAGAHVATVAQMGNIGFRSGERGNSIELHLM
jgi:hypothetical protein